MKPSLPERLAALDERALDQRHKLMERIDLAQERLRPSNIAHEAGNRALDFGLDGIEKARDMVRANPGKALTAALAAGALLARKPLGKLLGAGYRHIRGMKTASEPESRTEESED